MRFRIDRFHRKPLIAWLLLLTALSTQSPLGHAAEAYTLERLIALAREHNAGLLASRAATDAARAGIVSAEAFPNPEVEYLRGSQRARLPGVTTGDTTSVWLTQRLEYPTQRGARIEAAQAGARMAEGEARGIEVGTLAQLQVRYHDLLRRQAEAKAADEDLALMEQIRRRVGVRVETGEAPRYELIKAEAEMLNSQKARQSASLRVAQARAALRSLIGPTLPADFIIAGEPAHATEPPPLDVLRREVEERNPDLARARAAVERANRQLELERSLRLPGLALRAGRDQDAEVRTPQLGLAVTIPLFDRRAGPMAEAAAQLARARHEFEQQQVNLLQSLEIAVRQYEIARGQVTALESGIVRQAESALKVAEAAYRHGERGILDYLDAQRVHRAARNELIAARHELQLAAIEIERLRAASTESRP